MLVELAAATLCYKAYKYLFPSEDIKIKRKFQEIFKEKRLINSKGCYPKILKICITDYGAMVQLSIKNICSFQDLEKHKDYIKSCFCALDVNLEYKNEIIELELFLNDIQDLEYQKIKLSDYELLLGYDNKGNSIVVDMRKTPHLLISGLSGQGKSYMLKTIIKNLDSNVILINAFKSDFKDFKHIRYINTLEETLNTLESVLEQKRYRKKPLYLIFEELATIKDKKVIQKLKELLCVARHYNVFIIGVIQIATKEELLCKSYFNSRVSFKQVDSSSYQVALNTSIQDTLKKQEFYLFSDDLYKGKTYLLT